MMKRMVWGGLVLGLIGCGKKTDQTSPEAAIKGMFAALNAADFETAKLYVSKRTQGQLRELEALYNMSSEAERRQLQTDMSEVFCEELEGQMACSVCCTPAKGKASLSLMQENNQWFVHFNLDL